MRNARNFGENLLEVIDSGGALGFACLFDEISAADRLRGNPRGAELRVGKGFDFLSGGGDVARGSFFSDETFEFVNFVGMEFMFEAIEFCSRVFIVGV